MLWTEKEVVHLATGHVSAVIEKNIVMLIVVNRSPRCQPCMSFSNSLICQLDTQYVEKH